ncbi:esterase/lipase/thioesterase domain-containing protein [Tieghemostelium lacteum]|uniref:Esterase/lipase/thioesterase domain-containing protein n=1 Tax=Tieghemostelium lacteum TaxID=361077 RepID=A0A151ZDX4_TIELA|nr:esterase/lipase/thioesterase domain-containing protein [Tieghemostelium lacteum]|eukprot:KYQ92156.1 esterase/lipase/thioesterase domain-containing protein [Tieghemostelium lacteum]
MYHNHSLEKEAVQVSKDTCNPPFIFQLPIEEGRKTLEILQDSPVDKCPATIEDRKFELPKELLNCINVKFYRPESHKKGTKMGMVFYVHGAGWAFGSAHSHDKLIREICHRTNCVVVVPEYTRSPEAKFPVPTEQMYNVLCRICKEADKDDIDCSNVFIAGDSAGGNMAIVLAMMCRDKPGSPMIKKLLCYYPAIDGSLSTNSYNEFGKDFYLSRDGMQWFWDQYTSSKKDLMDVHCCPSRASVDQLKGLPETMILNGECDVLRDEGEAFAKKLREASVSVTQVRFQGMIHDFVMLNTIDKSKACRAAMDLSTDFINKKAGAINPRH